MVSAGYGKTGRLFGNLPGQTLAGIGGWKPLLRIVAFRSTKGKPFAERTATVERIEVPSRVSPVAYATVGVEDSLWDLLFKWMLPHLVLVDRDA